MHSSGGSKDGKTMERKWSTAEVIEALQQWDSRFYSESETQWLTNKAAKIIKEQQEKIEERTDEAAAYAELLIKYGLI